MADRNESREDRLRKHTDEHPYYQLDAGSPHMGPEDYTAMGLDQPTRDGPAAEACDSTSSPEDEKIGAEIRRRLQEHSQVEADRIEVAVCNHEVRLTGIATNRFAKRRAEELAQEVPDVRTVRNEIHIQPEQEEGGPILTTHMPGVNHDSSNQRS